MKKLFIIGTLLICLLQLQAQERLYIHRNGNIVYDTLVSDIDSITFNQGTSSFFNLNSGNILEYPIISIDSITFGDEPSGINNGRIVYIIYQGTSVTVINPLSQLGVAVNVTGSDVEVISTAGLLDIIYDLSGTTTDGSLTMSSDSRFTIRLHGVNITNPTGPAIDILLDQKISVELVEESVNTLADGSSSLKKAAFQSKGQLIFSGNGTLSVSGNKMHGIFSNDYIKIDGGTITISNAVTDGLHGDYIIINNGTLDITADGDGIDGGTGHIEINGGTITARATTDDAKAIQCDSILTINGGTINLTLSGPQTKGFKSKQNIIFNGGEISINASGNAVLTALGSGFDPSYCTGIKSDNNILINNGEITIQHSGNGGKGISADGNLSIKGGYITITTTGNGATYTSTTGVKDAYTATCMKSDGQLIIESGSIICSSSGTGGKGLSSDGNMVLGVLNADNQLLSLQVSTSGERITITSGSGGGGFPPQESGEYANPKAIKSDANLTINSGTITVQCTQSQEGGEGIESKAILTINGGVIEVTSVKDDAINSANFLIVNGGTIYCASQGNDGMDCNGPLTINGGIIISCGAKQPEEGFDCDSYTFSINGGIMIGTGGATSNPTASACTQHSIKYTGTAGAAICIKNSQGTPILIYQSPTISGSTSMVLLCSSPDFVTGNYTLWRGGTISGNSNFHGFYSTGTYNNGSSKSFTISSSMGAVSVSN